MKQCGQIVTIFCTCMVLSASTFWVASIWKMYSLPERRAGSPVHFSDGPRMAKSTPARWSSLAVAMVTLRARSSKLPAQPTQKRRSWVNGSPSVASMTGTSTGRPDAQSARFDWDRDQGFSWFSIELYILPSSVGKLLSISAR